MSGLHTVLNFTLIELMAFVGLTQAVYILVTLILRSNRFKDSIIPVIFFTIVASSFLLVFAEGRWQSIIPDYEKIQWGIWNFFAPASVILIFQILNITKRPLVNYLSLLIVPLVFIAISMYLFDENELTVNSLQVSTIIIGTVSLLVIGMKYKALSLLKKRKNGLECWWLIFTLIVLNVTFIALTLLFLNGHVNEQDAEFIRVILSLSFIYVASTILMRIYPYTSLLNRGAKNKDALSVSELDIALKIEKLIYREKVYQESSYNRQAMAQELKVSESFLSKIVNVHFQKTVPQLLNIHRIEEAKGYLKRTEMEITTIAAECGFNSISTFNRVFKEIAGFSPTEFRKSYKGR